MYQGSLKYQHELSEKFEEYFNKFGKDERPFGHPEQEYEKFTILARSKSYSLRNTPYREMIERMNQLKNEQKME